MNKYVGGYQIVDFSGKIISQSDNRMVCYDSGVVDALLHSNKPIYITGLADTFPPTLIRLKDKPDESVIAVIYDATIGSIYLEISVGPGGVAIDITITD